MKNVLMQDLTPLVLGLYNFKARLYDPLLGRFISADSIVPDPGDLQSLNRYSYCANNPLVYVDPSGNIAIVDDILVGALIGALIGGTISAITGGDIGQGMLTGAITGGFFGAAGGLTTQFQLEGVVAAKVGIHAAAGAMAGAANEAITGGDVGLGALTGGIAGGLGAYGGGYLKDLDYPTQIAGRAVIGGVSGGIAAELYGGDFGQGFAQGAWTAGFGAVANDWLHDTFLPWLRGITLYAGYGTAAYSGGLGNATASAGVVVYSDETGWLTADYGQAGSEKPVANGERTTLLGGVGGGPIIGAFTGGMKAFAGPTYNLTLDVGGIGLTYSSNGGGRGFSASWGGKGFGLGYYMNQTKTKVCVPGK